MLRGFPIVAGNDMCEYVGIDVREYREALRGAGHEYEIIKDIGLFFCRCRCRSSWGCWSCSWRCGLRGLLCCLLVLSFSDKIWSL